MIPKLSLALSFALRVAAASDFILYAYGSSSDVGIGGLPVREIDGLAYIIDKSVEATTNNVTFNLASTTLEATISDGTTGLLYIPLTSGSVGFTSTSQNSSQITTGFGFYGVLYALIDDSITTRWYAEPTEQTGIWQLTWASDNDDAVVVGLRTNAPSS